MTPAKNHARAVRYRHLALSEQDREKADVLYKLADEAERNVLCTSDWTRERMAFDGPVTRPAGSGQF